MIKNSWPQRFQQKMLDNSKRITTYRYWKYLAKVSPNLYKIKIGNYHLAIFHKCRAVEYQSSLSDLKLNVVQYNISQKRVWDVLDHQPLI